MGTSKSNRGPGPGTNLLPDWAQSGEPQAPEDGSNPDEGNNDSPQNNQNTDQIIEPKTKPVKITSGDWSSSRRSLTSFAKNPSNPRIKRAIKSYISSNRGSKNLAKSAISGKQVLSNYIGVLSSISSHGLKQTFENYGLGDITGLSIEMVFNRLASLLKPEGNTDEEAVTQSALVDSLSLLYDSKSIEENGIEALDKLSQEDIRESVKYYMASYIFERWIHVLGIKLEELDISPSRVIDLENMAKDFIKSSVDLEIDNQDFNSKIDRKLIDDIFDDAYILLEDL
jgi:hypothetical protein